MLSSAIQPLQASKVVIFQVLMAQRAEKHNLHLIMDEALLQGLLFLLSLEFSAFACCMSAAVLH